MMLASLAAAVAIYQGEVVKVIDGDTLKIRVAGWPAPFTPIDVRVYGLDTPEHVKPPARSKCEVAKGLKAAAFARGLAPPGAEVTVTYTLGRHDKYGRLLGEVTLPDGRDWSAVMIAQGLGRPYGVAGDLHKAAWCPAPATK